jgi:hypothetical protein
MKDWLKRIRGALVMGLVWGFGWGCVGGAIEAASNIGIHLPWFSLIDMWPQTLAIPGLLSGAVFSVVLRIAAGRRRFEELSVPKFSVWGALAGALAGGLLVTVLGAGLGFAVLITSLTTLLSAVSGSATLVIARKAEQRELLDAGADAAEVGLQRRP